MTGMLKVSGLLLFLCLHAHRVGAETLHAGAVTVEYDRGTFSFDRYDGVSVVPIAAESVGIQPVMNGVELNFNDQLLLSDDAIGESDPLVNATGNFNAEFSFQPDPGFVITGYRVTLTGTSSIEYPGEASITLNGNSYGYIDGFNRLFSEVFETTGPVAPPLTGVVSALGNVTFMDVAVGTQNVYVRSDYVPDPACPDPDPATCPLIEIPIYEEVTFYERQADLGSAAINLQRIRVEAITVPEPTLSAWLLILCPLSLLRLRKMRNQHS